MMNKREKRLVSDMREAMTYIPGDYDLEMYHFNDCDDCDELVPELCGWYAWMYTGKEEVPINHDYQTRPLITDWEVVKYHVDLQKCFDAVNAFVCG